MLAAQTGNNNPISNQQHVRQQNNPLSSSPTSMTSSDEPLSCSSSAPPSSASSSTSSSSLVAVPPSSIPPSTISDDDSSSACPPQHFGKFNNLSRPETIPEGVEVEINYDSSGEAISPPPVDDEVAENNPKNKSKKQKKPKKSAVKEVNNKAESKKNKKKDKSTVVVETQLNPEYRDPLPLVMADRHHQQHDNRQQRPDILMAMSHGGGISNDPSAGNNGLRRQPEQRTRRLGETNAAFTHDEDRIASFDDVTDGCANQTQRTEKATGEDPGNNEATIMCEEAADQVFSTIGTFGRWQRNVAVICSLFGFPFAWHLMAAPFFTPGVDHWCSKPKEFPFFNWTDEQWKNYAIPQDGQGIFEICEMYDYGVLADPFTVDPDKYNSSYHLADDVGTRKIACTHWDFNRSAHGHTVEEQWSLVCSKSEVAILIQVTYILGLMLGSLLFGPISDRVGRKPMVLIAACQVVICSLLICLCKDLSLFLVLRFLVAMGCQGLVLSTFVLVMETAGHKARSILAMVLAIPVSLGTMSVAGLASVLSDWTHLQLAISAPCLVFLGLFCFFPESPRWLLSTGKSRQAHVILQRISATNLTGSNKGPAADGPIPANANTEEAKKFEHEIMSAYIARHLRHASLASSHIDFQPNMTIRSTATMFSSRRGTATSFAVAPSQGICPNCAHSDALAKFELGYEAATLPMTASGPSAAAGGNGGGFEQLAAASAALDFSVLKNQGRKTGPLDLVRTPYMRRTTFTLLFTFFANGFAYYGLIFGSGNFVMEDVFYSVLVGGLVEIPTCLLAMPLILKAGRKLPFCIGSVIAGVACVVAAFITDGLFPQKWPAASLKLFARSLVAVCMAMIRLSSAELYPTTSRATGTGVTWGFGLLGGGCAVALNFLRGYAHPLIRFILFGSMSIGAGISALLMPETCGGKLLETIADVTNSECKGKSKCTDENNLDQERAPAGTSTC